MTAEEERNLGTARRWTLLYNDDPERFCDEMLTDDSEMHIPIRGDRHMGREACRAAVRAVLMAVPDRRQRMTATAVSGDSAFVEMFWEGTSSGEAPGWGEKGARVSVQAVSVLRIRDGRVASETAYGYINVCRQLRGGYPRGRPRPRVAMMLRCASRVPPPSVAIGVRM